MVNVSQALDGLNMVELTLRSVSQSIVDGRGINTYLDSIFLGNVQEGNPELLQHNTIEKRSWEQITILTNDKNIQPKNGDSIIFNGVQYNIFMVQNKNSIYGFIRMRCEETFSN